MTDRTVRNLVRYQETGDPAAFSAFWADAEAFVVAKARSWLVRHFVSGTDGPVDEVAIDEVGQQVAVKLLSLPAKPDKAGWYDPARFGWSPDRLRAWLYLIVRNEAVEYCKDFHGLGKKVSWVTFGDLEFNEGVPAETVLKAAPKVDFDAFELREIVAECVAELGEEGRSLYKMILVEGLPQREVAKKLGMSPTMVCHRWADARTFLRERLASRGIDESWVFQAA
jgi:RNA polymerase sigma factor (sigma-70 family)